jgi:glycosyltransferase involved in cell wall biosynthesis
VHVAINAVFLDQPQVGSGQYLRLLTRALAGLGGDDVYTLLAPSNLTIGPSLRAEKGVEPPLPGKFVEGRPRSRGLLPASREKGQRAMSPRRSLSVAERGPGGEVRPRPTLRILRVPVPRLPRALRKVWFEFVLVPLWARRLGADVLHYPYLCGPLVAAPPTVVTVHDLIPLVLPVYSPLGPARAYAWLAARAAARAAVLLADSAHTAYDISRFLGAAARVKTRVVPLAPDPTCRPVAGEATLETVRARYGLPERFLLYLGGFDWRKNLSVVLAAMARLGADARPLLVAAGHFAPRPPLCPDYAAEARARGVADLVRFIGPVLDDDRPALLVLARALVFPSRYEGFGLPPLEALACGTPVVCADASSLPEVVGDAALRVGPDDLPAWVAALERIWSDDALVAELRRRGRRQAAAFSWPATARATRAAYREAVCAS